MPSPLKRIVIIGPESTGKSTLCEELAAHYGTDWVPEYAREYLLKHGNKYRYEDLHTIAIGQLALEDAMATALTSQPSLAPASTERPSNPHPKLLFIDTDMYVMKVWSEFVYNKCEPWILDQIVHRKYDGYLLCRTDLPWTKDELREYPDLPTREKLFRIYKDCMINQATPWAEIGGTAGQRLQAAIEAVEGMIR